MTESGNADELPIRIRLSPKWLKPMNPEHRSIFLESLPKEGLLEKLSTEDVLQGLTEEQIETLLRQLRQKKDDTQSGLRPSVLRKHKR